MTCRLIVRRVKRLNPKAHAGQGELLDRTRYHPFITNSDLSMLQADERHQSHALIEQVMAELKGNALAHLPSGRFTANSAWLQLAVLAFNISRAAAHAAGMNTARMPTIRQRLVMVPSPHRPPLQASNPALPHPLALAGRALTTLWATGAGPPIQPPDHPPTQPHRAQPEEVPDKADTRSETHSRPHHPDTLPPTSPRNHSTHPSQTVVG